MSPIIRFALLLALLFAGSLADARTWTHQDGRTFEGELLGVEGDMAVIRRDADQQVFEVDIAVLSAEDQDYLKTADPTLSNTASRLLSEVDKNRNFAYFMVGGAALTFVFALFLIYRAGHFVGIPNWTFGRMILWQIYRLGVGILNNLALVAINYAIIPDFDWRAYYNNPHAYPLTAIQIALSIVFLLISIFLYAWFLKIGFFRTIGFLLLEVISIFFGSLCAALLTFAILWIFGIQLL